MVYNGKKTFAVRTALPYGEYSVGKPHPAKNLHRKTHEQFLS